MRIGGRVCLLSLLFLLTLIDPQALGQGARIRFESSPPEAEDRDRPTDRDQWFLRGRRIPGKSAAQLRYRAHVQKLQMRVARAHRRSRFGLAADTTPWTPLGPAPLASDASGYGQQDYNWVSGRATAVAIDPADSSGNTVYVGGAYGGVWKSTNAGPLSPDPASVHWLPVADDQATLAVGALAIQPQLSNPDPTKSVILVGTGETNSSADSYYGLGILRSADAGNTWTLITQSSDISNPRPFHGLGFSKIAFSTTNPQLVVAGAGAAVEGIIEDLEDPPGVNRGIYYSANGGVSWQYSSVKDGNTNVDPTSATTVIYNPAAERFYAAVRYHGFYSSSDGVNWSRMASQPGSGLSTQACPPTPFSTNCPIYRGELAVMPGRNEMYAWYVDSADTDQGIYRSTDGGASWTTISTAGLSYCGDSFGCDTAQGFYNLELAAVPNGTVTDLYAGAINLYKCTITSSQPNCTGTGSNTFLNLTHVYGCSGIARVHPDQHDLDFAIVNGKAVMYFANDGGLYRTLDAYTGLTTGTCGLTNQFDSLNQTLGSMTQFVSFSQHPSDANTLLGGTQDNGSPATASAQASTRWLNVNSGDGGYSAINPRSTEEWFTANTGLSIQRCNLGIDCHSGDFAPVPPGNMGIDHGAFYTPYVLDPLSAASELIVGTCRIWRGPGTGNAFIQLSVNFETGSPTGACTGEETNLVRSLTAGGPDDGSGFSKVIYAGTDGYGPQISTTPPGGHLWVTTNAAGGVWSWFDRTGPINPGHFPVSSVAMDGSDSLGLTAYVTVMGFGVAHVWKTVNGGSSWTDFTGNLPDVPANAIVVDSGPNPDNGTVYVGTDVGVFFSPTSSPNWTEVGPSPDSGQTGFLPNVAVTGLRIFDITTTKLLRASTYGRGIWQYPLITSPDFSLSMGETLTIFPSQVGNVVGVATAFNGYQSQVTLSCAPGSTPLPSQCDLEPDQVKPTPGGTEFNLAEAGPIGDYHFNIHGVGSDPDAITHDAPVTLHVVDFGLTPPTPSSTTANRPNDSDPVTFQVTASGSFAGEVSLSCSGLPVGAICHFSPASSVNPTSSDPVAITLTISTSPTTPIGTSLVTISADTTGAPAPKTQNLSFTVTALADFTLSVGAVPALSPVNHAVVADGSLTAYNGYASVVDLACTRAGTSPPPTCSFNPASITPASGGAAFTLTLNSSTASAYGFSVQASGHEGTNHNSPVTVTFYDIYLPKDSGTQTVAAGQAAIYTLQLSPQAVPVFQDDVTYSCSSGLPSLSSCSFNPAQVNAGAGPTDVTLSVQTTAPIALLRSRALTFRYALWLPLSAIALAFASLSKARSSRTRWNKYSLLICLLLGLVMNACGGGSGSNPGGGAQPGTPPGTYTITVKAASGTLSHTTTVTLTVQ